jgi:hypothetical protein
MQTNILNIETECETRKERNQGWCHAIDFPGMLYFLVTYAGSYGSSQQDLQRMLIMKNFRQLADDVYLTGNPSDFDLTKVGNGLLYDSKQEPAVFRFGNNRIDVINPMLFRYGEKVSVTRAQLDFGWWKFTFVEATPEMTVVFNPLDNTEESWDIMKNATSMLPDTASTDMKFRFAFCGYPSANDVSAPVEMFDFQHSLLMEHAGLVFSACSSPMSGNQVLVTLSGSCAPNPANGICITADTFYMAGSARGYKYSASLDLAAAIIGGTENGLSGHSGENLYQYKQRTFSESMVFASEIMAQRSRMLSGKLSDLIASGKVSRDSEQAACASSYARLAGALNVVSSAGGLDLMAALSSAADAYSELKSKGCELVK